MTTPRPGEHPETILVRDIRTALDLERVARQHNMSADAFARMQGYQDSAYMVRAMAAIRRLLNIYDPDHPAADRIVESVTTSSRRRRRDSEFNWEWVRMDEIRPATRTKKKRGEVKSEKKKRAKPKVAVALKRRIKL